MREERCARLARAGGFRAGGTASPAEAFVLVDVPPPWPAKIEAHPLLAPLAPTLQAHGARLQAVAPTGDRGMTRVVVHRRPPGPFGAYRRSETVTPTVDLADAVTRLLAAPGEVAEVVDLLVCTHGSRDVCCGADGTRLHSQLTAAELPGVRLWRTSHTGGHRFAPTALTFPDGRAWAWLDAELVHGIVDRDLGLDGIARHDRGCAAFADPFVQAAEAAVFGRVGWPWLTTARHATVEHSINGGPARVTITGDDTTYEVDVIVARTVPVPDCGHPLTAATKHSPELQAKCSHERPNSSPLT